MKQFSFDFFPQIVLYFLYLILFTSQTIVFAQKKIIFNIVKLVMVVIELTTCVFHIFLLVNFFFVKFLRFLPEIYAHRIKTRKCIVVYTVKFQNVVVLQKRSFAIFCLGNASPVYYAQRRYRKRSVRRPSHYIQMITSIRDRWS